MTSIFPFQCEILEMPPTPTCRSKFGVYSHEVFDQHACSWCYVFLFQGKELPLAPNPYHSLTVIQNTTKFRVGTSLTADSENLTTRNDICSTLSDDNCQRWRMCCAAGRICCERQLAAHAYGTSRNTTCGPTWDGYGCWSAGEAGKNSHMSCPTFLKFSIPTSKS